MSSSEERDEEMRNDDEDDKTPIILRTIVTGPEAGSIIGRKGETIKNIREESRAKIKIEGDGPTERIITVDGKTDSIFKAYSLICKVMESRERRDDKGRSRSRSPAENLLLKVLVPASQCGALIGKEGVQIKEMRSTTGAEINISPDPLPRSTEREMKIRGKREQITKCIFHVCSVLMENPAKGEVRLYRPESRDDRERDRDRSFRGERYGDRDYDRDYYGGRGRGRRDDTPPMRYGGGGGDPFEAIIDFAKRYDGSSGRSGYGGRMRESKHEMYVSNDQVGAIIGRKGSKIKEIRTLSGADINILEIGSSKSRRDFVPDQDRERIIEITGTPEQVAIAKSLISVAVELGEGSTRRDPRRSDRDRSRSRDRSIRSDDRRRW